MKILNSNLRWLAYILIFFTSNLLFADSHEEMLDLKIVPAEDFYDVFSDTEIIISDEEIGQTNVNEYYENGTISSKRNGVEWKGFWYMDQNKQHCVRWNHKDSSNCALIMQDDEGNWVKVKDEEVVKRYKKIKPLPKKKTSDAYN